MFGIVLAVAAATPGAPPTNPDPKHLAVAPADHARAKSLVEKLASPDYEDRQKAHAELADMGRAAVPALTEALARHPSAEVRSRCQALFPRARADDLEARLAAFAADETGKFEHDVPGWDDFRRIAAGFGPAARAVFLEIATSPLGRELVLGDLPPEELGARIAVRRQALYTRRPPVRRPDEVLPEPPVLDVMALMLAETRVPARHVPRPAVGATMYATPWIQYQLGVIRNPTLAFDIPRALLWNDRVRVYRAIAGKWVVTRDEPITMSQALTVGTNLELPEAGDLAARMLTTPGVAAVNKAPAAMVVGRHGDPKLLPALEAVFKDDGVVRVGVGGVVVIGGPGVLAAPVNWTAQLRDVALVAAVLMTGQQPREYGFEEPPGSHGDPFVLTRWHLPPDRRAAAFERWQAWRAANPDFGKDR
jgi:hypothetical protein